VVFDWVTLAVVPQCLNVAVFDWVNVADLLWVDLVSLAALLWVDLVSLAPPQRCLIS